MNLNDIEERLRAHYTHKSSALSDPAAQIASSRPVVRQDGRLASEHHTRRRTLQVLVASAAAAAAVIVVVARQSSNHPETQVSTASAHSDAPPRPVGRCPPVSDNSCTTCRTSIQKSSS